MAENEATPAEETLPPDEPVVEQPETAAEASEPEAPEAPEDTQLDPDPEEAPVRRAVGKEPMVKVRGKGVKEMPLSEYQAMMAAQRGEDTEEE